MTNTSINCTDCNKEIDLLDEFPKGRCLDCHAAAPEVRKQTQSITASGLAAVWGNR